MNVALIWLCVVHIAGLDVAVTVAVAAAVAAAAAAAAAATAAAAAAAAAAALRMPFCIPALRARSPARTKFPTWGLHRERGVKEAASSSELHK